MLVWNAVLEHVPGCVGQRFHSITCRGRCKTRPLLLHTGQPSPHSYVRCRVQYPMSFHSQKYSRAAPVLACCRDNGAADSPRPSAVAAFGSARPREEAGGSARRHSGLSCGWIPGQIPLVGSHSPDQKVYDMCCCHVVSHVLGSGSTFDLPFADRFDFGARSRNPPPIYKSPIEPLGRASLGHLHHFIGACDLADGGVAVQTVCHLRHQLRAALPAPGHQLHLLHLPVHRSFICKGECNLGKPNKAPLLLRPVWPGSTPRASRDTVFPPVSCSLLVDCGKTGQAGSVVFDSFHLSRQETRIPQPSKPKFLWSLRLLYARRVIVLCFSPNLSRA